MLLGVLYGFHGENERAPPRLVVLGAPPCRIGGLNGRAAALMSVGTATVLPKLLSGPVFPYKEPLKYAEK